MMKHGNEWNADPGGAKQRAITGLEGVVLTKTELELARRMDVVIPFIIGFSFFLLINNISLNPLLGFNSRKQTWTLLTSLERKLKNYETFDADIIQLFK